MSLELEKNKYLVVGFALIFFLAPFVLLFFGALWQFFPHESVLKALCKDNVGKDYIDCINDQWETTYWIIILLFIPYIIQFFVGVYGYKKTKDDDHLSFMLIFCFLTFCSILPYSCAWILYNWGCDKEYLSYVGLFIIFILVGALLLITSLLLYQKEPKPDLPLILPGTAEHKPDSPLILPVRLEHMHDSPRILSKYINGLKKLHFLAVMHFFAMFLSIAFIAGFALAFHDRDKGYTALHMENLEKDKTEGKSEDKDKNEDKGTLCKIKYHKENEDGVIKKSYNTCFYFSSDGVNLERLAEDKFNEQIKQAVGDPEKTKELTLKRFNDREFENVSECITSMEKKKVPIVYIVGKTDPKTPKDVADNYQLSSIRASNLYLNLTKAFSENQYDSMRDIQWRISSGASYKDFTLDSDCQQLGKDELSNKRIVEILVESVTDSASIAKAKPDTKPLNVMDYMYFSLYTITTTGYGDIKPVTAYAKFICSLENIIEVFFLVIFVNILISFKESKTINKLEEIEDKLTKPR